MSKFTKEEIKLMKESLVIAKKDFQKNAIYRDIECELLMGKLVKEYGYVGIMKDVFKYVKSESYRSKTHPSFEFIVDYHVPRFVVEELVDGKFENIDIEYGETEYLYRDKKEYYKVNYIIHSHDGTGEKMFIHYIEDVEY